MNVPDRYRRILPLIEEARPLLQSELDRADHGEEAVDSTRVLRLMQRRLNEIESSIISGSVNKNDGNNHLLGYIIVDTWPYDHPLAILIGTIEYEYYRK